ncbi:hypothetical protein HOLleu_25808 [Holothuria leucospilota]|uniref:B box-type domain-containing protein n=1 Tax=Holothuria leucospilota TaxID=206669 RepID=A0A9Q1BTJ7_HOLLE|nr:hypothetical protein HOLleu_25808 [Holothuria leucospilota]
MLASMRDAPRCHIHLEEISKLYCETCDNLSVCMACTYGEHKGHNLHEVKALAKLKREELTSKLKELEEIEKGTNLMTPRQAKEKLILNVGIEREKAINMHDEEDQKIVKEMQNIEERRQQVKEEKQTTEKKVCDSLQREMENKILEIKLKYQEILMVKKSEIGAAFQERESSLKKELNKLLEKRKRFNRDKTAVLDVIKKQLNENVKIIETMSEHFDNITKRFEALNEMASSILASGNDWSAVQCIPDMCTAATNLMKDLKADFPDLTTFTGVSVNYKQYSFGKRNVTKISEQVKKTITLQNRFKYVGGMTSSGDGNIVISGCTSDLEASFIIVVDMDGRILKEKKLKTGEDCPIQHCKFISQHKVATVCTPNEIGLYDVRDGSYIKKNISDVFRSWPKERHVTCVATDPVNNHILVGGNNSRNVYVFNDRLNYLRILTLPEMIKWPRDITVSGGHLLVCDYDGKKCFVTTMDGMEGRLVGELMKPNLAWNSPKPISVCSDRNGFMYVLWQNFTQHSYRCYLVQYNHDGSQVLTTRKLEGSAEVVTLVETFQREKLLVATYDTQTVYLYDLLKED